MPAWLLAVFAGLAAATLGYAGRPWSAGLTARIAALARAAAVLFLVALLLDAPAGRTRPLPSFVALDVSLSWLRGEASGGSSLWVAAREELADITPADTLFLFGDSVRAAEVPEAPSDLASRLQPVAERAIAAGRALTVVTDGELDDAGALQLLPSGSSLRIAERPEALDLAVVSLAAPRAAVAGDTAEVTVGVSAGNLQLGAASLAVLVDSVVVATATVPSLGPFGEQQVVVSFAVPRNDGQRVLRAIATLSGDTERRNDTLSTVLEVSPAAGVVLVSTQPDLDVRHMLAVLRGTVTLPTRAYLRVAPGRWRLEGPLTPVSEAEVRAAVSVAPVVILHGDTLAFGAPRSAAAGALLLFSSSPAGDDWYISEAPSSPFSAVLSGISWDSLPPVNAGPIAPGGDFTVLEARLGRQGPVRAIIAGSERPRRVISVGGSAFWRWHFRPGPEAQAFPALWGGIFDWLAAGRTDVRAAVADGGIVRAGETVRWRRGSGSDSLITVTIARRGSESPADTLRINFPEGEAVALTPPLPAGVYDVAAPGGASLLVVNASGELVPRAVRLEDGPVGSAAAAGGSAPRLREAAWPYIALLVLLCAEWVIRRRAGMR